MRSNGWLAGEDKLPLGFKLDDPETKRPVVGDPEVVAGARLLLSLAAKAGAELDRAEDERRLDPAVILDKLARAGVRKRSNRRTERGESIDTVNDAKAALVTLLSNLSAYEPGGVLARMQVLPITGLTRHDVHGHDIFKRNVQDPEEKGAIRFQWRFPAPRNGAGQVSAWAGSETLRLARRYYEHLSAAPAEPGSAPQQIWPLVHLFTGEKDGKKYRLLHGSRGYQWKREGVAVGKFDDREMVERFVGAAIAEIDRLGLKATEIVTTPALRPRRVDGGELHALESERDELRAKFKSACAAERGAAEGSRVRAEHKAEAERLEKALDELDAEIAKRGVDRVEPEEADRLVVHDLATLFSVLKDTAGEPVPPEICTLLGRLVVSASVEDCWDDASPWATFQVTMAVPTERDFPRHIDFSFELGNTSQGPDRKAFFRRMDRVLEMRMTREITIEELARRLGAHPSPRRVAWTVGEAMRPLFRAVGLSRVGASSAATALVDHPILSTRAAVYAMLNGAELPETIEDLSPAETERHLEDLRAAWLDPNFARRSPSWSSGGERSRREMIRWVGAHSRGPEDGARVLDLMEATGLESVSALSEYLWTGVRDGKARVIERTREWPSGTDIGRAASGFARAVPDSEKRVRLRPCPHCGHADGLQPLGGVELGTDPLLCPACHCQADDSAVKRPQSYLLDYEGPFGRREVDGEERTERGKRRGTIIGPPVSMPSARRVRKMRRRRPR